MGPTVGKGVEEVAGKVVGKSLEPIQPYALEINALEIGSLRVGMSQIQSRTPSL